LVAEPLAARRSPPYVIGLTGGIGSGKSAAAACFAEFGALVIDTDAIAHELTGASGAAMPAIAAAFGTEVVDADGALNRAAMRQRVFAYEGERQRLEGILHPMIRSACESQLTNPIAHAAPYVILMVPLLVETGAYRDRVHRIAVVDCAVATQIQRVMARNGLTRDEVQRIIAAQACREQRLAAADDVIDNDGDFASLAPQISTLDAGYRRNRGSFPQR
jgi:dephospho-CoA kinase